ncbi:hypothetical protein WL93_11455 [Burkholderia diffusa]|uniref:hypothetical protein n=1 Tax=Burkholderia diffusa TaxID=488732 RepID=UPI00075AB283|nr:hypothetical protein WL93_11455 [Burkholderia diffusa]
MRTFADTHWRPLEFSEGGKDVKVVPLFLDVMSQISGLGFEYVDDVSPTYSRDAVMSGKIELAPNRWKSTDMSQFRGGTLVRKRAVPVNS